MDREVVLREHRFVRGEDGEVVDEVTRAYEKALFKDFVIADLSRFEERMLGLRWRTADEVQTGKGDAVCAAKGCHTRDSLVALELLFSYREAGEDKRTLVTCVVCPVCAEKVRVARADPDEEKRKRKEGKRAKKAKKKAKKEERKKRKKDEEADMWSAT